LNLSGIVLFIVRLFANNFLHIAKINQYKRICTINARKIDAGFDWQPRFHDHIIRDAKSFERIQNYIATNPQNWKGDKFY